MFDALRKKKILLTGGTGFIGRAVVNLLLEHEITPVVFSRQTEIPASWREKVRFVKINLLAEADFSAHLKREQPDVIFHFAGTRGGDSAKNELCRQLNFEASARLLDAAARIGCERLILLGSADEYGHQPCPQREDLTPQPVSPYAVSKARATLYALEKFYEANLQAIVLRVFSAYGVGQPKEMFVAEAIDCAVSGKAFRMTTGTQRRDFIFVDDVVEAILRAAIVANIGGKIINVGSGTAIALRDAARLIWQISEADEKLLNIGARPAGSGETHDTWADISRARELLDWQPRFSLEDGLRQIIERRKQFVFEKLV
jgi:UDP-glucose 4-epimerase